MISPLLDLFYQLRDEEGFLLSIEQYDRVKNYIIQKFADHPNTNPNQNPYLNNPKIKRLCQALWVKSLEEKQKFDEAWGQMLQIHQEVSVEIKRENLARNQQESITTIETENPNETITITDTVTEPNLSPSSPSPSAPQLSSQEPQIGTAIEKRKKWNPLPKDRPEYYPIGTAKLQESWEQLHPLPLESPRREWDIKSTVLEAAKRGFFEQVIYKKKQLYRREIVIFIDRSDSMIPFAGFGRTLVHCWQDASSYYFDNVINEEVLLAENGWDSQSLNTTLLNYPPELTSCLIYSDAGAARKRYVEERFTETENFIRRLTRRFSRVAWLNPLPPQRWWGTTALDIDYLAEDIPNFSMFGLEIEDFENLITWLKEEAIPPRQFQADAAQQWNEKTDDYGDFFTAESRLRLFEQDHDSKTLDLAKRSAFPLSLSPDLLYYLRQHQDREIQPPWYAVADILLSNLVRRVDRELYEMSPDIRKILLEKLTTEELQELAKQLQEYIQEQIGKNSPKTSNLQHQEWLSLAYLQPSQAVNELKQALTQALENNNRVRLVRLTKLLESLSPALEDYEPLLIVTEPIAAYSRGDLTTVSNALELPTNNEKALQDGLIDQVQNISPFKLEPLTINIPTLQFVFTAETVFVDKTGTIIRRQPIKAYYYDEILDKPRQNTDESSSREDELNKGEAEDNLSTIRMIYIPEGEFYMGTPDEEIKRLCAKYKADYFEREKPQHLVKVPSFYLSQTPITQAQWKAIASREDLKVERDLELDPSYSKGENLPVEQVSWEKAVEFCQRLSKLTRKAYQLPSEAQWEYACRAAPIQTEVNSTQTQADGTSALESTPPKVDEPIREWNEKYHQPFHFGETLTSEIANYYGSETFADEPKGKDRGGTTPVGQFPPNAFGLYDMHGNVWEWCEDDYHSSYEGAPIDGSAWKKDSKNSTKILRGGSWLYFPRYCRSADRNTYGRGNRNYSYGIRVMCWAGRTL